MSKYKDEMRRKARAKEGPYCVQMRWYADEDWRDKPGRLPENRDYGDAFRLVGLGRSDYGGSQWRILSASGTVLYSDPDKPRPKTVAQIIRKFCGMEA